eukprot:5795081-Pyramimonas_sp.AAC.1
MRGDHPMTSTSGPSSTWPAWARRRTPLVAGASARAQEAPPSDHSGQDGAQARASRPGGAATYGRPVHERQRRGPEPGLCGWRLGGG